MCTLPYVCRREVAGGMSTASPHTMDNLLARNEAVGRRPGLEVFHHGAEGEGSHLTCRMGQLC